MAGKDAGMINSSIKFIQKEGKVNVALSVKDNGSSIGKK
jgi:hypothetical protein